MGGLYYYIFSSSAALIRLISSLLSKRQIVYGKSLVQCTPLLRWHYISFNTITNSSASTMHILTFMPTNMLACIFHLTLHDGILFFPLWACCRSPVTSTPAATYPINRFPIDFSRYPHKTTVLTALVSLNGVSSVLHFRSALRHTTDNFFTFSYTLSTPTFARSTYKCFTTSTCMKVAEDPPPSHKEHCPYFCIK